MNTKFNQNKDELSLDNKFGDNSSPVNSDEYNGSPHVASKMETTTEEQIYELDRQLSFLENTLQGDIESGEADDIQSEMDWIRKEIRRLKGED